MIGYNPKFTRFNAECLAPLIQQMFQDNIDPFGVAHEFQFFMGALIKPVIADKDNYKDAILLMPLFLDELDLPEKYTGFVYLVIENSGGLLHKLGALSFSSKIKLSKLELQQLKNSSLPPKGTLRKSFLAAAMVHKSLESGA
jgi:hypothetical protein